MGLVINVTYDPSVANAPAGFKTDVAAAVQYFENQFTNPVTVNIDVGYGEVAGQSLFAGALGESQTYIITSNYSQVRNALIADAQSAADQTAIATLPSSDPTNGATFWVPTAEAKALGLYSSSGNIDGYVGFSNAPNLFCYNSSGGVPANQYDFYGVVLHEISEVLGRQLMAGGPGAPCEPLDLFHYSAASVRDFSGTQPGYFSIDGGKTNLDNFNTNSGGDFGDWAGSAGNDAALAFCNSGVTLPFTQADRTLMDVIGWNLASSSPPPTAPTVTQVVASPATGDENAGHIIKLTLGLSAAVTVLGGTPTLSLNDGSVAIYDAAATAALNDATKLVFDYTVAAGQNTAALAVTGANLNGATIADSSGNAANLSGADVSFPNLQIDTTAPTVNLTAGSVVGVESTSIHLSVSASVQDNFAGANITSLLIGSIPVGATLSDGTHSFTATTGNQQVDVHSWTLASLTIMPVKDSNFALTVQATGTDGAGNTSTTSTTEAVTVDALAPTVAPVAETGTEGSPIALNLGTSINSLAGDNNSLASLQVSAIPVGATLSDGIHNFTATAGNTSVDVHAWNLANLTIKPANDSNFTLNVAASVQDAEGNLSTTTTATESVTVNPLAPTVAPVAEIGTEGSLIAFNLGASINGLAGDNNSLASLQVSAIPVGATLSDGTHNFTATAGNTSVDVHTWNLAALTITHVNDANFSLGVAATSQDAGGNLSTTTTATESVTVNPLAPTVAPVAEIGTEGSPIALNLGTSINGLAGDNNSLASLQVSAIPVGATLSDGAHSFTATAGNTTVDVHTWNLTNLTIAPANDTNFSLNVAATAQDAEGNLSATASATETITLNPLAPTLAPVAETGTQGSAIALNLGTSVNALAGDSNSLASLVVSAIPLGATLSDGTYTFTASSGTTAVDIHTWNLNSLTITPVNGTNFTLNVAAIAQDAEGNLSATASATETVTVSPQDPAATPLAATGLEGSPIAVNLGALASSPAGGSLTSVLVSSIPVGATLSDGTLSFTATAGSTAVDVHTWNLASLTITPASDTNFTLSVAATAQDAGGNLSTTTATEAVTVNPLAPSVAPVGVSGVEGSPIALNLGTSVNGLAGDANSLASLMVSAIPVGATLGDGTYTFTASAGNTAVDIRTWNLANLTITPANDTNFALAVAATAQDAEGNLSTTTSGVESVRVDPLAPTVTTVAGTGREGSPIALNLGTNVNGLAGDANALASLMVSAIPVGATLSDGTHTFTASAGNAAVDVHTWNLANLTITPTNDTNFTLSAAATARDSEGNLNTIPATEAVTVNPLAPTVRWSAQTGVKGSAITLGAISATVNGFAGDQNTLRSLVISSIPIGAKLTDANGDTFTATSGQTSVDVVNWNLSSLAITLPIDQETGFTLTATATETDAEGNTAAATATEVVNIVETPTLTVNQYSLSVAKRGSVSLPIRVTSFDSDDTVLVKITGLTSYEKITDKLDHKTFTGNSITLTAAEVNSGLTLISNYAGSGHPVNSLTVTASNATKGEFAASAAQTIVVTDNPTTAKSALITGTANSGTDLSHNLSLLLNQYMAVPFGDHGQMSVVSASSFLQHEEVFLTKPHA